MARLDRPLEIDLTRVEARLAAARDEFGRLGIGSAQAFADLHMVGPAGVRRITASAAVITDDHPWLEFHPPQHLSGLWFGAGLRPDEARGLELLYRLRSEDPLPLSAASPAAVAELERARRVSTRVLLARLYRDMWLFAGARAELEAALREALSASEQASLGHMLREVSTAEAAARP